MDFLLPFLPYLIPILATILVWIIYRVFKLTIDKAIIEEILQRIADLLFGVEKRYEDYVKRDVGNTHEDSSIVKKSWAEKEILTELPKSQIRKITKKFGSVDNAIERAFHKHVQPELLLRRISKQRI